MITFLLSMVLTCFCQIGTTNVAQPIKEDITEIVFDSTRNYWGRVNISSYTGQLLFVLPQAKGLEKWGYSNFKPIDYNHSSYENVHYGRNSEASEYNTKYEDLANKYFHVDSVVRYKNKLLSLEDDNIFYLTEKDNPANRCCFVYDSEYKHNFPFMVVSHFNYLKNKFIGKKFIIAGHLLKMHDIITGNHIVISNETKVFWTVMDITIVNDDNRKLSVIVTNRDMTSCVSIDNFEDALNLDGRRQIFEKNEWDKLVLTYGLPMMQTVMSRKIKVGMPSKLLIMSWGKPDRIHSASYGDQYVYGNQYVYVKKGKITSWN